MDNWCDWIRNNGRCDVVIRFVVLQKRALHRHKRNGKWSTESVDIGAARCPSKAILAFIDENKLHKGVAMSRALSALCALLLLSGAAVNCQTEPNY